MESNSTSITLRFISVLILYVHLTLYVDVKSCEHII
jgi:hypothetical protein